MVKWYLSNQAQLLERLRKVLGGTERPDQLYWYTGVMPTLDIGGYLGANQKNTSVTITTTQLGSNAATLNPNIQQGKRLRVGTIAAWISNLNGGTSTLAGVGIAGNDPTGAALNIPLGAGSVSVTAVPIVGLPLGAVYMYPGQQVFCVLSAEATAFPTVIVQIVGLEEDDPQI